MSDDDGSAVAPALPDARADDQPDPPLVSEYQPDDIDPEEIVHAAEASAGTVVTDQGDRLEGTDADRVVENADDGD